MATQQKQTAAKSSLKEVVIEGAEKLEQVTKEASVQATEAVTESKEKIGAEAKQLNASVQDQLRHLKQDVLNKLDQLKVQFGSSQKDFSELKEFVKTEFNTVIDDLSKLGKELKEDVTQISGKHKDHLTETFKRSKEHTLEAWKKISPVKAEVTDQTTNLKS
ncbi:MULTISPECIES: hypothetical protein [unclassified Acinetobacter]|uniref:hypothetical protein n=1 Tax=unclassified Acinetobacter TaxID=196816 RepID=UPI0015D0F3FA|nr:MULTISPECIES: hypothetical protein [unclassified Acinetobacter]